MFIQTDITRRHKMGKVFCRFLLLLLRMRFAFCNMKKNLSWKLYRRKHFLSLPKSLTNIRLQQRRVKHNHGRRKRILDVGSIRLGAGAVKRVECTKHKYIFSNFLSFLILFCTVYLYCILGSEYLWKWNDLYLANVF